MTKPNPWVWTRLTESKYADRKAGSVVPIGYLTEGDSEWFPPGSWIRKGYVERRPTNEDR